MYFTTYWKKYIQLAVCKRLSTVEELLGGTGNYSFDWEVKAVRQGHENYEVIRPTSFKESTNVTKREE